MHNHIYISAFYAWWIKWSFKYKSGWSLYQSMYSWMDRCMRSNNALFINQIWMIWESDLYGSYHYIMHYPYTQSTQLYIHNIRVCIAWSIQLYPFKNRITIYLCIPIYKANGRCVNQQLCIMSERERIMQVMAQKGFTASQFAEAIGIQRAAMSHITSGRNNPSLDVMKKILERFPDISPDWLLMEKGPMKRGSQPVATPPESTPPPPAPSLFVGLPPAATPSESSADFTPELPEQPKTIARGVERILLFYSDGTFESFVPERKEQGEV